MLEKKHFLSVRRNKFIITETVHKYFALRSSFVQDSFLMDSQLTLRGAV